MKELPEDFKRGVVEGLAASQGFVLGRGRITNTREGRIGGGYELVGVMSEDYGRWQSLQPCFWESADEKVRRGPWLEERECLLVAIPVECAWGDKFTAPTEADR